MINRAPMGTPSAPDVYITAGAAEWARFMFPFARRGLGRENRVRAAKKAALKQAPGPKAAPMTR